MSTIAQTQAYSSSDEENPNNGQTRTGSYAETSSIYQINKILSSENYAVGKNVQNYLKCFQLQYRSLRESAALLPAPM